jgi:hypothetical protein
VLSRKGNLEIATVVAIFGKSVELL